MKNILQPAFAKAGATRGRGAEVSGLEPPPSRRRICQRDAGALKCTPRCGTRAFKNKNYQTNPFSKLQNPHKHGRFSTFLSFRMKKRTHFPVSRRSFSEGGLSRRSLGRGGFLSIFAVFCDEFFSAAGGASLDAAPQFRSAGVLACEFWRRLAASRGRELAPGRCANSQTRRLRYSAAREYARPTIRELDPHPHVAPKLWRRRTLSRCSFSEGGFPFDLPEKLFYGV